MQTSSPAANVTDQLLARSGVVAMIGRTPLVRLHRLEAAAGLPEFIELWLKAEWTNPGGSVKDRPALGIVRQALNDGLLESGKALIDSTSGNTGIAFAMLGAALGFPVTLVLPASASDERKRILAAYGATVIESDPYEGSDGAIRHVRQLVEATPEAWVYANQYGHEANPAAHYATTGPEIWGQTAGRITHFVAGLGTTGTMMGVGRFLKEQSPDVELLGVEPAEPFHGIEGLKHLETAIVPPIYDPALVDRHLGIDTNEAFDRARELADREGLFVGTSTGAAIAGALQVAAEAAETGSPAVIVAGAPDNGSKYLSTGLWGPR